MPSYSCEKCGKVFKQKSGFTDHTNKKVDCSQNTIISTVIEKKVEEKVKEVINKLSGDKELVLPEDQIQRDKVLQGYFEEIHNILWSRAGFEPAKAMEHLTFFFAYRLIEIQAEKLELPAECRWSYLVAQNNENDMFETMRKGYIGFNKNKITKPFFNKPEIKKATIVYDIVKHINKIPKTAIYDTDTLGNIFEYAQSWGTSTMGSEGQFFTNRKICKLAFKLAYKIKGTLRRKDNSLCTFADWFCGTGGFPAEYVKGVNENLKDVNWEKDKESIYCQDQSVSACMTTLLNLLIMTGTPFSDNKIRQGNSFGEPVITGSNAPFKGLTVDYAFLNPPYGGSKFTYSKKNKDDNGMEHKHFSVNEDIQSIGIEDDDKVSAGVQLAMATLSKDGGICSIVLPQGFFFGATKKCVELRKKITEEYKIHYVVDIASGSFINTGTKTSMLIFQKGVGKTEVIKFIGLDEKLLVEATLADLCQKKYSLNYKQYLPQEAVELEGFEMVKLGDIASVATGKNKTPDDKKGSKYPYYGTSGITGYTDYSLEDGEYILTARNGTIGNTFLISGKSYPSDHMFTLHTNDKCMLKYLYHWMISNKKKLEILANTTTIPGITRSALIDVQIPLPSLRRQQEIVTAIDVWNDFARREEEMLGMLEKQIMFYVKEMGHGKEGVKLKELLKPVKGKRYSVGEGKDSGKYPLLRSSKDGKVKWMDNYTYEGPYITVGNGGEANFRLISKFNASTHTLVYDVNERILKDFAYYSIQSKRDMISEMCFQGTGLENLNINLFMEIEILLPSLAEQQTLQSDFNEIYHKQAKIAEYKAKAQNAIQRLIPGASPA